MRIAAIAFLAALGIAACGTEQTASYHNALTGASCSPDMATFVPKGTKNSKHAGCDTHHCCILDGEGECDGHADAGTPDAIFIP
jgi:hypothetical protein